MFFIILTYISLLRFDGAGCMNITFAVQAAENINGKSVLECSWEGGTPKSRVSLTKVDPRPFIFHIDYKKEVAVNLELWTAEWWSDVNMITLLTDNVAEITITSTQCTDIGEYLCVVDEYERTATLNVPRMSSPVLQTFHNHFNDGIGMMDLLQFHCDAKIISSEMAIYWLSRSADRNLTKYGSSGEGISVTKANANCIDMVRSTLSLRASADLVGSNVMCRLANLKTDKDLVDECTKDNFCVTAKSIKIRPLNICDSCENIYRPEEGAIWDTESGNTPVVKCNADIAGVPDAVQVVNKVVIYKFEWPNYVKIAQHEPEALDVDKREELTASVAYARKWSVNFMGPKSVGNTRNIGIEVRYLDVRPSDLGFYYCAAIYEISNDASSEKKKIARIGWSYVGDSHMEKPQLKSEHRLLHTQKYVVNATCSAFVGNNGRLSWILQNKGEILSQWTFYYEGGDSNIITPFGAARRSLDLKVEEPWISSNISVGVDLTDEMMTATLNCSIQEPDEKPLISLQTSTFVVRSRSPEKPCKAGKYGLKCQFLCTCDDYPVCVDLFGGCIPGCFGCAAAPPTGAVSDGKCISGDDAIIWTMLVASLCLTFLT